MFIGDDLEKAMAAPVLAALLAQLPPDALVSVNRVGNLLILDAAKYGIGYIDFASDSIEMFETETADT